MPSVVVVAVLTLTELKSALVAIVAVSTLTTPAVADSPLPTCIIPFAEAEASGLLSKSLNNPLMPTALTD